MTTEGSLAAEKFVYPIGMAVDTEDASAPEDYAIYVLDLINPQAINTPEIFENHFVKLKLQYRLRKFDTSGHVLASRTFTLESSNSHPGLHAESLAVDSAVHRVYVLIEDAPPTAENEVQGSYAADRIDAWTTGTGSRSGESALTPASGLDEDKLNPDPLNKEVGEGAGHPKAGELAGPDAAHDLQTGAANLAGDIEGESLAIDGTGESSDLALAGNEYVSSAGTISPTIEGIVTHGAETGALDKNLVVWHDAAKTEDTAATAIGQKSGTLYAASANPDGSLNVSLGPVTTRSSALAPAEFEPNMALVSGDLTETTPLLPSENVVEDNSVNFDRSAADGFFQDLPKAKYQRLGESGATPSLGTLAPTVVQLSGGGSGAFPDGLYAGLIANPAEKDLQRPDEGLFSWRAAIGEESEVGGETVRTVVSPASLGIRIFDAAGDSLGMIGNATLGGPCNLQGGFDERFDEERGSFAALVPGREGVLFALTQPDLEKAHGGVFSVTPADPVDAGSADQVVEFKPNDLTDGQECPQPSGDFSITNESAAKPEPSKGSAPLTVPAGSKLKFDASELDLRGGAPWAYDWSLEGEAAAGMVDLPWTLLNEFTATPGQGFGWMWPSTSAERTYSTPGVYQVSLNVINDFGTYETQRTLTVEPTESPVAKFTVSADPKVGQPVTLDASASTVPAHDSITNYAWEYDGGEGENKASATTQHKFLTAGNHEITLKITDAFHKKVEVSQTINVAEAEKSAGPPSGEVKTEPKIIPTKPAGTGPPSPTENTAPTEVHAKLASVVTAQGSVAVTVSCPQTKGSCSGTIALKTASAVASSKSKKHKASPLSLGQASFSLTRGQSKTVDVKLSSKGISLLRAKHTLKVVVTITATDPGGHAGVEKRTVTLSYPAKHRKKGKRG
ncbi:MAG TPA: PKD domain-containing protein [Solirubrobacteraceae bacterium]|nr:PKD domain-containing protein [Solirubrobacteraceae bacterium]